MITWKVRYYDGTTIPVEITSDEMSWEELPIENVIEVDIINGSFKHTLRGFDNYWLLGNLYGMFNNTGSLATEEERHREEAGHQEVVYEGEMEVAYSWEDSHIKLDTIPNISNVHIISGVMIPDDHAKVLGLI